MLSGWQGVPETFDESTHELFFEHEGNAAVRRGNWKLVRKFGGTWELYDLAVDRTEVTNVAADHPELVLDLISSYQAWAARVGVIDYAQVLASRRNPKPYRTKPKFDSNPRVAAG